MKEATPGAGSRCVKGLGPQAQAWLTERRCPVDQIKMWSYAKEVVSEKAADIERFKRRRGVAHILGTVSPTVSVDFRFVKVHG